MDLIEKIDTAIDFGSAKSSLKKTLRTLASSGRLHSEDHIIRIEQPIDGIDPLKWLRQQKTIPKIYWSERNRRHEAAGIGCANMIVGSGKDEYSTIFKRIRASFNSDRKRMRYYGGFRFNLGEKPDSLWEDFGASRFILPLIEIIREDEETKLAVNLKPHSQWNFGESTILEIIDKIEYNPDFQFDMKAALKSRIDVPDKQRWLKNIDEAKQLFQNELLAKIVLARRTMLEFSGKLDAIKLLAHLKSAGEETFGFYFQSTENLAFFGASPELLYYREKNKLFSEAVAGTRPRGKTPEIDENLADELLNSDKDIQEHELVCKHIEEALSQLCSSFAGQNKVEVLKSEMVQHLYKKYEGTLKADASEGEIISKLHPTPAVGLRLHGEGKYAVQALHKIREIEQFDRGWYAGPVGWVGADSAEFAVGIRSGLAKQNKLFLFSGAGILPDSDAEKEWTEIEHKISQYLKIFQN